MEFLVALFVLLLVYLLVKRLTRDSSEDVFVLETPDEPPTDESYELRPPNLYEAAERLSSFYEATAHPQDLVENSTDFERTVRSLLGQRTTVETLVNYATGDHAIISCCALEALRRREDGTDAHKAILGAIGTIAPWPFYFGLQYLTERTPPHNPVIGRVLASVEPHLQYRLSRTFLAEFIQKRIEAGEAPSFEDLPLELTSETLNAIRGFLNDLEPEAKGILAGCLDHWQLEKVDERLLGSVGKVWDDKDVRDADSVVEHLALNDAVERLEEVVLGDRPAPSLLIGERGVGKTAIMRKFAQRIHGKGWIVFVCAPTDLIAGQIYIGQIEERLKAIADNMRGERRAVWLMPSFHLMAYLGRGQNNPTSVLDITLPLIEQGSIRIIGETTPTALNKVLQIQPRVSTAFSMVRVEPLTPEATRNLAEQWLERSVESVEEGLLDQTWDFAQQYLNDWATPGNLLSLLEATAHRVKGTSHGTTPQLALDDVLVTLTSQTGMPLEILDQRQILDVEGLREALSERVIGQEEAVECLVERIAMMKAGVTDPTRPVAVFLFAGPTGTGKTEIAKTLAQWLFGDAKTLIRVDMSELQAPESLARLTGRGDDERGESLADEIRRQPFSVVLLDEFEKAHPKVWDTFLQVFDDARITDVRGQIADFRHAVIILTSNLGSTIPTGASIGFGGRPPTFYAGRVQAAIEKLFRTEFINRLDRVVVFRPLNRGIMRKILQKELSRCFQRRGLKNRAWAVEWDESAIEFLLEKGFTPDLGARPLKRAIERYLLSPLAMTIVSHQVPEGDQFLFVSCKKANLEVTFVDPDAPPSDAPTREETESLAEVEQTTGQSILLQPRGTPEEIAVLRRHWERLVQAIDDESWQGRKEAAFAEMGSPGFWSSSARFSVLGLAEYIDRVDAGVQRAGSLLNRLEGREGGTREKLPANLVGLLAQNLFLLDAAHRDVIEGRPREAFLAVDVTQDTTQDWHRAVEFARQIATMYEAWANTRRMRLTHLESFDGGSEALLRKVYAVSGYAAYSLLAPEKGLHVLEWPGPKPRQFERVSVRVGVVPYEDGPPPESPKCVLQDATHALRQADTTELNIVRRYREKPSPLVRDAVTGWRSGRLDLVLAGNFDALRSGRIG